MARLEIVDESTTGTVIRLFLVICPALVIGTVLGSLLVMSNASLARTPHAGVLSFVVGGLIAGVAAGLLIGPPQLSGRPTIIVIVIDLLVVGALAIFTLSSAARVIHGSIDWMEVPILLLAGTVLQVAITRVIWALSDRRRP